MKIALLLLALYVAFGLYLYFFQERILFRPDLAPKEVALPKEAKVMMLDGIEVGFIDNNSSTTLFYFGGNANNALEALGLFVDLPYNVVTLNYPGYGHSAGKPSQEAIFAAAKKVFEKFQNTHNILIGRSLGTGVAAYIAAHHPVDGIVLITPFHSITHLAKLRYPIYPASLLVRHPFATYRYMQKVTAPTYIILAEHDDTTPPATLRKLLPHIKNLKKVITIPGAHHGDILQYPATKEALHAILKELSPLS